MKIFGLVFFVFCSSLGKASAPMEDTLFKKYLINSYQFDSSMEKQHLKYIKRNERFGAPPNYQKIGECHFIIACEKYFKGDTLYKYHFKNAIYAFKNTGCKKDLTYYQNAYQRIAFCYWILEDDENTKLWMDRLPESDHLKISLASLTLAFYYSETGDCEKSKKFFNSFSSAENKDISGYLDLCKE